MYRSYIAVIKQSGNCYDPRNVNLPTKVRRNSLSKFGNFEKRDLIFCERLERLRTPRVGAVD